jgi:hypothetical protein
MCSKVGRHSAIGTKSKKRRLAVPEGEDKMFSLFLTPMVHPPLMQTHCYVCVRVTVLPRYCREGVTRSLWNWPVNGPIVHPPNDTGVHMEQRRDDTDREKAKDSAKTCPKVTWSTTRSQGTVLRANPGPHGDKPAANRLSYVTPLCYAHNWFRSA